MICLKICTFVVSATTLNSDTYSRYLLWFAWKFVPLWYQQQHSVICLRLQSCCDLLENLYLCGISNNDIRARKNRIIVVICLKICTFVVSATTPELGYIAHMRCDLLENLYLCGISNNLKDVVASYSPLWFAWKFVPLWYQQQRQRALANLETVVICLKICTFVVSATTHNICDVGKWVVICLKICTFVVSATTHCNRCNGKRELWFAWKFVPLWYQQQHIYILITQH